jgi:hypothetical protein
VVRTAGTLAQTVHIGRCSRGTSRPGDECGHLPDELIDIARIVETVDDDFVRNLNVLMHQHVSKSDGLPQCVGEIGREYIVRPEQPHRVAIVGRRPPPSDEQMCWATSMQASIAVTNVYFTPRNHIGSARRASSAADSPRRTAKSSVIPRSKRRTRASSTTTNRVREFLMSPGDPWQLVEVDLARRGLPHHPSLGLYFKEKRPVQRNTARKFKGSVIKDEQVNPWGQQNLERLRPSAKVGGDIDIGREPRSVCRLAPMQVREHGPLTPQRLDSLGGSRRDIGHGEIVSSSSGCRDGVTSSATPMRPGLCTLLSSAPTTGPTR